MAFSFINFVLMFYLKDKVIESYPPQYFLIKKASQRGFSLGEAFFYCSFAKFFNNESDSIKLGRLSVRCFFK